MKKIDLLEYDEENLRKILLKENIINADIIKYMEQYYLDYALSVIVERALADVSDGLKPVHRRIIWAMSDLGIIPEKGYKKCARIVGEVLGKYHVHGDSSVYGALVRLAQDFSTRYMLVDGHGNFGSVDGDSAAAMRYTEAKMTKMTQLMVEDIGKNTIDFIPNFDGEEKEPVVLPSRYPNLLVNGSFGIAVGISSNIPPHNLRDSILQAIHQIDNPNCSIEELVNILKAPDFPTGASIINPQDMVDIYSGLETTPPIIMRGKYRIENKNIIFYELPYGVNKEKLMTSIIKLKDGYFKEVKKGKQKEKVFIKPKISQLTDALDFSNERDGINIILKVNSENNIDKVLALLFANSELEYKFCPKFTAIDTKTKKLYINLSLKDMNNFYINHQKEVVKRRSEFDLNKALNRQHILEGLTKALNNIDQVINLIKSSKNNNEAINKLIEYLDLSNKQAEAIIEMRLRRLTNLEIEKIELELQDLNKQILYLQSILNNEQTLLTVLKDELLKIADKYSDDRRSEIIYEDTLKNIDVKELEVQDYNCRIFYTNKYIKKHLKQSDNHKIVEGNTILGDFTTTNKSTLLIFTNKERRFRIQCSDLEQYQPSAHGTFVPKLLGFEDDEEIIKIVSVEKPTGFILIAYESGDLAKIKIDKYMSSYKKLEKCYSNKSKVLDICYSEKDVDILMISNEGKGIIFNSSNFNAVGSTNSQGNVGMKLNEENKVISAIIDVNKEFNFELQTQKGKNKEFMLSDIAPTNKQNEERTLFQYLYSKRGNQGNFLINTRNTEDEIIELIVK